MDPIAKKGIFVGYNETSKAYQIYILALQSVVVKQDVRFEERAFRRRATFQAEDEAKTSPSSNLQ